MIRGMEGAMRDIPIQIPTKASSSMARRMAKEGINGKLRMRCMTGSGQRVSGTDMASGRGYQRIQAEQ